MAMNILINKPPNVYNVAFGINKVTYKPQALFLRGVSVPGEVSLVGVDNNPLGKMALPSLTSIDVHCRQQAELSIRKLISFVCGEEYDPLRFLVPTELVQGDSVKQA